MNDENERSVASLGSVAGEPACWAAIDASGRVVFTESSEKACGSVDPLTQRRIVPLYRSPTLTVEEREALERLCEATSESIADDKRADGCHWQGDAAAVAVVRGLLERTK